MMSPLHALLAPVFLTALVGDSRAAPGGMRAITKGRVVVSCDLSKPALPDSDFVITPPKIQVTIDYGTKRAIASSSNGIGGSMRLEVDLSDTGHQSASALFNPSNGWMAILMTTVDAKTSDIHVFKLYLQRSSDTAPYRILDDVVHGGHNPVSDRAYGYLALDVFKGKTCNVAISGQ